MNFICITFTLNVLHGHLRKLCKVVLMNVTVYGTLTVFRALRIYLCFATFVMRFLSCSTVVISTAELFIRNSSSPNLSCWLRVCNIYVLHTLLKFKHSATKISPWKGLFAVLEQVCMFLDNVLKSLCTHILLRYVFVHII